MLAKVQEHQEKMEKIAGELGALAKLKAPLCLRKNSVPHLVPNPKDPRFAKRKLDLRSLNQILEIDTGANTCTAESGVAFDQLVHETLKHQRIPMVVPELKTVTVGGAVSGCSLESMSYLYGGFHDTCLEYEILTGDGRVITATPEKNSDVFQMIHGSYGTLGIITKVKFKLLPVAGHFVKMSYHTFTNVSNFFSFMRKRWEAKDHHFIDGIIHSPSQCVVCLGDIVAETPFISSYQGVNIYYKSTATRSIDYLTLKEYFFRYDTECHWLTRTFPPLENKLVRLLLGKKLLGSTNLIKNSRRLRHLMALKRRQDLVVDVFVPAFSFEEFYKWYEKEMNFFPLWAIPYRMPSIYPWVSEGYKTKLKSASESDRMIIDCGVYGMKNSHPQIDYARLLEQKLFEFSGMKTLISKNSYSEEEFWSIFHRKHYLQMKEKLDPHSIFENIYDKFNHKQQ
ncbi:MAG: FAD-binding oxidoreductase [Oligoflexia bacterium]|nr:FAD-binding oxidoreductase [Oligoflexia bacterium]MBF0366860.1 FAD-binding oxidoreductase [Oligoflexia bacterium]